MASDLLVCCEGEGYFVPRTKMAEMLHTGKPAYACRAFELPVTLDLEIYKATRRLAVPADLEFSRLHGVLQEMCRWKDCHLYKFTLLDKRTGKAYLCLIPNKEDLEAPTVLLAGHRLSGHMLATTPLLYTYDKGDNWIHTIEPVREIEEYNGEFPYLLEAIGQAPPEDIGELCGYLDFYKIMLNPKHPQHRETKEWVGHWPVELQNWESPPRCIRC